MTDLQEETLTLIVSHDDGRGDLFDRAMEVATAAFSVAVHSSRLARRFAEFTRTPEADHA